MCKLRSTFLPKKLRNYWNNLPVFVKCWKDVNDFKTNLKIFKKDCKSIDQRNFSEFSNLIFDKIKGPKYLVKKDKFNKYLLDNPFVAKKKEINTFRSFPAYNFNLYFFKLKLYISN